MLGARFRWAVICPLLLGAMAGTAPVASAAPLITEFSMNLQAGSAPQNVAAGPDGNVWFPDQGPTKEIGRITPGGAINEFMLPMGALPSGITGGPDGNL